LIPKYEVVPSHTPPVFTVVHHRVVFVGRHAASSRCELGSGILPADAGSPDKSGK
jgi:hypothetical protein